MRLRFPSRGLRAWFAWQCLPRDRKGAPPSFRSLERQHGLSNNDLSRLVWDAYERLTVEKARKFAAALGTTAEWLEWEEGPGPMASLPVPERPAPPPGKLKRTKSGSIKAAGAK